MRCRRRTAGPLRTVSLIAQSKHSLVCARENASLTLPSGYSSIDGGSPHTDRLGCLMLIRSGEVPRGLCSQNSLGIPRPSASRGMPSRGDFRSGSPGTPDA